MNQSDLIQNILAVERQANELTGEASEQSALLESSIDGEIQAMQERYRMQAQTYLQNFEAAQRKQNNQALQEQDTRRMAKLRQVEAIYQAHREEWVEAIFQRIVGKAGG